MLFLLFLFVSIGILRAEDYYVDTGYFGQEAVNILNNADSIQSSASQTMPTVNYLQPNLPYQGLLPMIDYQKLNLEALSLQEKLGNYSMQVMQKNDENQIKYMENNNAPAYTGQSPQEYKYNPAYTPSLKDK